jgi:hypothetical protein
MACVSAAIVGVAASYLIVNGWLLSALVLGLAYAISESAMISVSH